MLRRLTPIVIAVVLAAGCGHAQARGVVDGSFRIPGGRAADIQRAGLNFSAGRHGKGGGHTVRVGPDGRYSISLPPGSYSVIGGLSGHAGGPAPESCAGARHLVVTAKTTTRLVFVCRATPVSAPSS